MWSKVFPGRYIHLGGDECPTDRWKENALCQQRIKDNKLNGVSELQPWLVHELAVYLKKKYNKDIVAWDELIEPRPTTIGIATKVKFLPSSWLGTSVEMAQVDGQTGLTSWLLLRVSTQ